MEQIFASPVRLHAWRPESVCPNPETTKDLRWHLLDLVRQCRSCLHLRDRDITVLRGLLSLVPAPVTPDNLIVFASNRVLIERCDGIDERTLRRRIQQLQTAGLVARKQSPNGKRYQIRSTEAEMRLVYGIDLSPLFALLHHLEALAERVKQDDLRCASLRALIRDRLYHHADALDPELQAEARLSLRRALSAEALQSILDALIRACHDIAASDTHKTPVLTASDSQNDRHIQTSDKENFDSEGPAYREDRAAPEPESLAMKTDISVGECIALARSAVEMAPEVPRTWDDLINLSLILAPAIGLTKHAVETARGHLGTHGAALAILGLVEAFGRIRNPQAYLLSLSNRARQAGLDLVRMFRSLASGEGRQSSARA